MELIDAALGIRIFQQTWWYPGSGSMIFLCGYSTFVFNYDQLKHLKLSKSPDTDEWLCFLALCIILTRNCVQKLAILQYNRSQLFYEVFPWYHKLHHSLICMYSGTLNVGFMYNFVKISHHNNSIIWCMYKTCSVERVNVQMKYRFQMYWIELKKTLFVVRPTIYMHTKLHYF